MLRVLGGVTAGESGAAGRRMEVIGAFSVIIVYLWKDIRAAFKGAECYFEN